MASVFCSSSSSWQHTKLHVHGSLIANQHWPRLVGSPSSIDWRTCHSTTLSGGWVSRRVFLRQLLPPLYRTNFHLVLTCWGCGSLRSVAICFLLQQKYPSLSTVGVMWKYEYRSIFNRVIVPSSLESILLSSPAIISTLHSSLDGEDIVFSKSLPLRNVRSVSWGSMLPPYQHPWSAHAQCIAKRR